MLYKRPWLARPPVSLLLLALAGIGQAHAQSVPADGSAPALSAQRVFKDPKTGELRAPEHDEQAAARDAAAAKAAAPTARGAASADQRSQAMRRFNGIVPLTASNGATGRRLDMSRLSFAVAKRNADGSLSTECVPGESAAQAARHGHAHADAEEASHAK